MLVLLFEEISCIGVDVLRSRDASSELYYRRGNITFKSVLQTYSDTVTSLHSLSNNGVLYIHCTIVVKSSYLFV